MKTLRKGSRSTDSVVMLQELLNRAGYRLPIDGDFGSLTDTAVRGYQKSRGLVVDGLVGEQTWLALMADFPEYAAARSGKFLSEEDLGRASAFLDVEVAAMKAVTEVEAAGQGFVGGRPRILFEGHVFWKRLIAHGVAPSSHRSGNEDILFPNRSPGGYLGGVREHDRLEKARRIHDEAALESASWGLFQIMGYHWSALSYPSISRYVGCMNENEGEHLGAFTRFVRVNKLAGYLRNRQWAEFARRYNGPAYRQNRYDEKLERAYRRFSSHSQ